ncbi:MAG: class I SAM-dependent methyltransferase [Bacteriovoracaceae bacterium]|nr:class I SAM-dependent methyltransferase [Bacteriovoracaceae bacterium]
MSNLKKAIKNPVKAIEIANRRYFQIGLTTKDPEVSFMKGWVYGSLKRERLDEVFSGIENTNYQIVKGFCRTDNMSMTLQEINVTMAILNFFKAKKIFEIGTFDGGTTVNLAANTPEDGIVYTADLPQDFDNNYKLNINGVSNNQSDPNNVGKQYRESDYKYKVKQILEDSAKIDFEQYDAPYDLFFIDGCHDYEYVKKDTESALKHTKKGGVIIWHDYGMIKDVSTYIDEIKDKYDIRAIKGTRLAVYQVK